MANAVETWASGIVAKYQDRIANMLGFDLPYDVKIKALSHEDYLTKDPGGHLGFWDYDSKTIYIDRENAKRNDPGFIVHELTHAFQGQSTSTGKRVEGLADWVRYKLGLTYPGWTPSERVMKYDNKTPAQIRRIAARQSSIDGTESPAQRTGDNVFDEVAGDIIAEYGDNKGDIRLEPNIGKNDVAAALKSLYKDMIAAGLERETALKYINSAEVSRSGNTIFTSKQFEGQNFLVALADVKKGDGKGGGGDDETTLSDFGLGEGGITTEPATRRDYLGRLTGSIPITGEIRRLAEQAVEEQWTTTEWDYEVSKTNTYFRDQSIGYNAILQQFGMSGDNLNNLMRDAVESGYTEGEFMYYLRQTDEYRQRFRGIFRKDGTLRMSEGEYLAFESGVQQLGKEYGYKVDSQDIGESLRKGISLEGFEDRLSALQRTREYAPAMRQFQQTLKARGLLPPGAREWTKQEQYEFVTGQSNPQFYRVWEEASARTAAFQAGINVRDKGEKSKSEYTEIRRGAILRIIKGMAGYQTEEELAAGFDELGTNLLEVLPLS